AALGVMLIYRLLHETGGPFVALASTVALCTFMAAPAFQMAYTEGTALLLLALALWCLRRQRYGLLILVVLAVSLTRPIVIPLAVVIGLHWLARWRRRSGEAFPLRERFTAALATFVAVASAAIWPTVAAFVTGRPNAFSATQAAWGNTPDRSWLIAGLTVKSPGFLVLVAIGALLPVLLAARPPARKWGSDWRAWLIAYAVYLLVAGRPSPSLIRYAMLAVVPWWPLPELGTDVLNNPRGAARWLTLAGLAVIGLWCQYVWIQHFVLITGPSRHYYP
ncbi:MAG: hypothetical protein ACXV4A_11040, partial [Actinomycetes bacterium]